jgi:hypothetical protein
LVTRTHTHTAADPARSERAARSRSSALTRAFNMRSSVTPHRHSLPWGSATLGFTSPAIVHRMRVCDARAGGLRTAACFLLLKDEGRLPSASTCTCELKLPPCTKVSRAPKEAQDGDSLARSQDTGQVRFKFNDAGAWPLAKERRGPSGCQWRGGACSPRRRQWPIPGARPGGPGHVGRWRVRRGLWHGVLSACARWTSSSRAESAEPASESAAPLPSSPAGPRAPGFAQAA